MATYVRVIAVLALSLSGWGCATTAKVVEVPLPAPPAPTAVMVERLSSPDPEVRAHAAWQLAGAVDSEAELRAALTPLRADPDKVVRYGAAWALGHLAGGSDAGATPPRVLQRTRPRYPQDAFNAKIQGTVLVEILIGEDGEVAHAVVRRSIPQLDEAALASVRQWRFEPSRIGGKPVAILAHAPVRFSIY